MPGRDLVDELPADAVRLAPVGPDVDVSAEVYNDLRTRLWVDWDAARRGQVPPSSITAAQSVVCNILMNHPEEYDITDVASAIVSEVAGALVVLPGEARAVPDTPPAARDFDWAQIAQDCRAFVDAYADQKTEATVLGSLLGRLVRGAGAAWPRAVPDTPPAPPTPGAVYLAMLTRIADVLDSADEQYDGVTAEIDTRTVRMAMLDREDLSLATMRSVIRTMLRVGAVPDTGHPTVTDEWEEDGSAAFQRLWAEHGRCTCPPDMQAACEPGTAACDLCRHLPDYFPCPTTRHEGYPGAAAVSSGDTPREGERVQDGGQWGTLVRCPQCSGDGLLLRLDPEELERMRAATPEPSGDTGQSVTATLDPAAHGAQAGRVAPGVAWAAPTTTGDTGPAPAPGEVVTIRITNHGPWHGRRAVVALDSQGKPPARLNIEPDGSITGEVGRTIGHLLDHAPAPSGVTGQPDTAAAREEFRSRLEATWDLLSRLDPDDNDPALYPNDPECDVRGYVSGLWTTLGRYGDVIRDEVWDTLTGSGVSDHTPGVAAPLCTDPECECTTHCLVIGDRLGVPSPAEGDDHG